MSDEGKVARPHQNDETGDEVEGHGKLGKAGENVEAADETETDDEVEAHNKHRMA